jgi:hypothetical protein
VPNRLLRQPRSCSPSRVSRSFQRPDGRFNARSHREPSSHAYRRSGRLAPGPPVSLTTPRAARCSSCAHVGVARREHGGAGLRCTRAPPTPACGQRAQVRRTSSVSPAPFRPLDKAHADIGHKGELAVAKQPAERARGLADGDLNVGDHRGRRRHQSDPASENVEPIDTPYVVSRASRAVGGATGRGSRPAPGGGERLADSDAGQGLGTQDAIEARAAPVGATAHRRPVLRYALPGRSTSAGAVRRCMMRRRRAQSGSMTPP